VVLGFGLRSFNFGETPAGVAEKTKDDFVFTRDRKAIRDFRGAWSAFC